MNIVVTYIYGYEEEEGDEEKEDDDDDLVSTL